MKYDGKVRLLELAQVPKDKVSTCIINNHPSILYFVLFRWMNSSLYPNSSEHECDEHVYLTLIFICIGSLTPTTFGSILRPFRDYC